jgi:hypothetical protein
VGILVEETSFHVRLIRERMLCLHTITGEARNITLKNGTTVSLVLAPNSTTLMNGRNGEPLLEPRTDSKRETGETRVHALSGRGRQGELLVSYELRGCQF